MGGRIVLMKDDFFLLQTGYFLTNFFFLSSRVNRLEQYSPVIVLPFSRLSIAKMPSPSQNTDAMTFSAEENDLVFFVAEQPASVYCFDCCLDSCV